jgi:hypothetical protein
MARNQKNFSYFAYLDDNAANWNVKGEDGGALSAVDGHTTNYTHPVWQGQKDARNHPRYVVAVDPTTFRSIRGIVYTPTAYAAIDIGDTISVQVTGLATNVDYTVTDKIAEKKRNAKASFHLTL